MSDQLKNDPVNSNEKGGRPVEPFPSSPDHRQPNPQRQSSEPNEPGKLHSEVGTRFPGEQSTETIRPHQSPIQTP